MLLKVELLDI